MIFQSGSACRLVRSGDRSPPDVIATLKEAGLRGMGGAGFPAGTKWELVGKAPGTVKYVI